LRAEAFDADPEMQKFEDWQDRAGKMMYTEDKILLEKWQNDVKQKRRSIEPPPEVSVHQRPCQIDPRCGAAG